MDGFIKFSFNLDTLYRVHCRDICIVNFSTQTLNLLFSSFYTQTLNLLFSSFSTCTLNLLFSSFSTQTLNLSIFLKYVYLCIFLYVYLPNICVYLCGCLYVYLCISVQVSVCLSVHICVGVCMSICAYLSIKEMYGANCVLLNSNILENYKDS